MTSVLAHVRRGVPAAQMVQQLHAINVRVILWATSMVDTDSPNYEAGVKGGYYIKNPFGACCVWCGVGWCAQVQVRATLRNSETIRTLTTLTTLTTWNVCGRQTRHDEVVARHRQSRGLHQPQRRRLVACADGPRDQYRCALVSVCLGSRTP